MPGKHGGFFRRLNKKTRRESGKRRRGTTGMSKDDRRNKHNALVDETRADRIKSLHEQEARYQRDLIEAEVPKKRDAEGQESGDDDEDRGAASLAKLRAVLGCQVGPQQGPHASAAVCGSPAELEDELPELDSDAEEDDDDENDVDVEDGEEQTEDGGSQAAEEEEEGEEAVSAAGDDEDDNDGDDVDDDGEGAGDAGDGGDSDDGYDFEAEAGHREAPFNPREDDDNDDEVSENEDTSSAQGAASRSRAAAREAMAPLLRLAQTVEMSSSAIKVRSNIATAVGIHPDDPYWTKLHLDTHGKPDTTAMETVAVEAGGVPSCSSAVPLVRTFGRCQVTGHARRRFDALQRTPAAGGNGRRVKAPLRAKRSTKAALHDEEEATLDAPLLPPDVSSFPLIPSWESLAASPAAAAAVAPVTPLIHPWVWQHYVRFVQKRAVDEAAAAAVVEVGADGKGKHPPLHHDPRSNVPRSAVSIRSTLEAFSPEEWSLFAGLASYSDVSSFRRTFSNADTYMNMSLLHVINHWCKSTALQLANDAVRKEKRRLRREKVATKRNAAAANAAGRAAAGHHDDDDDEDDVELRDRGFGRTRVLVILPMRNIALRYVRRLLELLGTSLEAEKQKHVQMEIFENDFSEVEEAVDRNFRRRPLPYRQQFEGNINDNFCFGMSMRPSDAAAPAGAASATGALVSAFMPRVQPPPSALGEADDTGGDRAAAKKRRGNATTAGRPAVRPPVINIYTHVLNSDIIFCSPIGLRKRLHKDPNILVALSSIEVLIVEEAHVLYMQNWQQLMYINGLLNKRPEDTTEGLNDVSRVFQWAIDGKTKRHRQTVLWSEVQLAPMNALGRASYNSTGRLVLLPDPAPRGVMRSMVCTLRHHFVRLPALVSPLAIAAVTTGLAGGGAAAASIPLTVSNVDDHRFHYFTEQLLPARIQSLIERQVRVLIVIPSFFDFIRLREYCFSQYRGSYDTLSEETALKDQRRALTSFTDLERPLLLMTERYYFFRRYFVQLAETIVFYSPPVFPQFYKDMVEKLQHQSANAQAITLFSPYDRLELSRIVGEEKATHMVSSDADAFVLVTSGV